MVLLIVDRIIELLSGALIDIQDVLRILSEIGLNEEIEEMLREKLSDAANSIYCIYMVLLNYVLLAKSL